MLLGFTVGAFAHNDGIVNHDTQHQNEAKEADHIQAGIHVGRVEGGHGSQKAHWNAEHYPEGEFDLKK